jgi:hypothetical protein
MMLPLVRNSWTRGGYVSKLHLLGLLLFGFSFTGCNSTCFIFTSNPPTGTIDIRAGNPPSACTLAMTNGTVRVLTHTVSTCTSCSASSRIAHIFVSLRGIEVHPSAIRDAAASDWQELMPLLHDQPLQFDLVSTAAGRTARLPLGQGATIPADAYRQLRLRFVPNQPSSEDSVPEKNACGVGFNCVVSEDGRTYPLLLDDAPPEFRLISERIAGGVLLIPPDSSSDLIIDFKVGWVLSSFDGEGVRPLPVLIGSASVERRTVETIEESR